MLFILIIVLVVLDLLWINLFMKEKYELLFNDILKNKMTLKLLPAMFTYALMIFALYYFVLQNSENSQQALIKGCLMGLIMYGVYDGTLYSFLPIDDYKIGVLDVSWGIFICGFSSFIAYSLKDM